MEILKLKDIKTKGCNSIYVLTWSHGSFIFSPEIVKKYDNLLINEIHVCDGKMYIILKKEESD